MKVERITVYFEPFIDSYKKSKIILKRSDVHVEMQHEYWNANNKVRILSKKKK